MAPRGANGLPSCKKSICIVKDTVPKTSITPAKMVVMPVPFEKAYFQGLCYIVLGRVCDK